MKRSVTVVGILGAVAIVAFLLYGGSGRRDGFHAARLEEARARPWFHRVVSPAPPATTAPAEHREADVALTGVVRDQITGDPIPDAEVRSFAEATLVDVVWADRGGAYSFPPADPTTFDRVAARANGYAVAIAFVPEGAERVDLLLSPSVRISGRVETPAGEPLAGVEVIASDTTEMTFPYPQSSKVLSAADGAFRIEDAPAGRIVVEARKGRHIEAEKNLGPLGPGREVGDVILRLAEGAKVVGMVRLGGKPIAGASVLLVDQTPGARNAVTNADGAFEIDGVTSGSATISASAAGAGLAAIRIEVRSGAEVEVMLDLHPGARLEGTVRDEAGAPIDGADVRCAARCGPDPDVVPKEMVEVLDVMRTRSIVAYETVRTDADGKFRVTNLFCGLVNLRVSKAGLVALDMPGVSVPASLDLRLEGGIALRGTIVDPSGRLAESARGTVEAWGPGEHSTRAPVRNGTFTLGGLVVGEWGLSFSTPELGTAWTTIAVAADTSIVKIEMPGTAYVTGRVLSGRTPLPGATVGVGEDEETQVSLDRHWETRTGADGRFRLSASVGEQKLVVYHPEHRGVVRDVVVNAGKTTDLGDLELVRGHGSRFVRATAGLGVGFESGEEGEILVSYVWERSGAHAAGIAVRDEVVSVDGVAFRGLSDDDAKSNSEGEPYSIATVVVVSAEGGEAKTLRVERLPGMDEVRLEEDGGISTSETY